MTQQEKIAYAWQLFKNAMPVYQIAEAVGAHRETVGLWIAAIKTVGSVEEYVSLYDRAKKGSRMKRKRDPYLVRAIYRLRETHKGCCGQKIQVYLRQEGITPPSVETIYQVLRQRYALKKKYGTYVKRGHLPRADAPRQVVQMDTVDFGGVYAFTSVDTYVKDVAVTIYPDARSVWGAHFLRTAFTNRYHHVETIQTDGGSEFKDEFKAVVGVYTGRHRVARPYKKNEQAFIESFNKTLRKECLGWSKYKLTDMPYMQKEVDRYLAYYHNTRVHMGLNMQTPNQVLKHYNLLSDI